jgi:phospholipid transport system substrate-binding protein
MRAWILSALLAASPVAIAEGPVEVIKEATDEVAGMIEDNRDRYERDPEALRRDVESVLLPIIDADYTARLVLGRHSRGLESDRIEAFADALAEQLLDRYATELLEYDLEERVQFLPLSEDNSDRVTRVRTRVRLDNGERAPVDYVMRKTEEGWMVFDVLVEGISYVATFRSQVDQEIRRTSFESLLDRLAEGKFTLDVDD